jgi:hypothetical protein
MHRLAKTGREVDVWYDLMRGLSTQLLRQEVRSGDKRKHVAVAKQRFLLSRKISQLNNGEPNADLAAYRSRRSS